MNKDYRIISGIFEYYGPGGDVELPDGITTISNNALKKFTSAIIPDSVTNLGEQPKSSLQRLVIGAGVEYLRPGTFWSCKDLKSVVIGPNVERIGGDGFGDFGVFHFCKSLETVVIGDKVEKIGASTFAFCENLKKIIIPKSVKWIGKNAFVGCPATICCRAKEHEVSWHKKWNRHNNLVIWGYED